MGKALLFWLILVCVCTVNAQSSRPEIVSSAGETFQGNTIQIDWTLGELAITSIQNSSQQITQGFHQPTYIITSTNELPEEISQIRVFPNPTSERIIMTFNFDQIRNVKTRLIDLNGRSVWSTENTGSQFELSKIVSNLPSGNYLLNFLIDGNKYSQTFKVIKTN